MGLDRAILRGCGDDLAPEVPDELPEVNRFDTLQQRAFGIVKSSASFRIGDSKPDRRVSPLCPYVLLGLFKCIQRRMSNNGHGQFQFDGRKLDRNSELLGRARS